ncbi:ferroptosis suppressor protein 1-like [Diadema antillarum]|uniref:ferroptosis suppressor protein 1-like n=2 Tax=Diadema antillarum TaxID=105358 RepID=UPI003A871E48
MGASSSSSGSDLQNKTVVIVGSSFAGKKVGLPLRGKCKLVVIDTREALHLAPASPRALVDEGFVKKTFVPIKDIFGESFRRGKVAAINPSEKNVTLADGEIIAYDYLVIATGSSGPYPGKVADDVSTEDAVQMYKNTVAQVKEARTVTIIGGGAVGVEIAGEIATDFPDKKVILVHSRNELVEPPVHRKLKEKVKRQLENLNVQLILGERVDDLSSYPTDRVSGPREVKTDKGRTIQSDLVFVCVGGKINNQAYQESLKESMDQSGYLMVDANLRVKGHDNIFAVGDCCDADVQKMLYRAERQAEALVQNILRHSSGRPMKAYKQPAMLYAVSLGRNGGAIQIGNVVFGAWFMKRLKGADLFAGRMWEGCGLPVPRN